MSTVLDDVVRHQIVNFAIKAVIEKLVTALPFLGLPFINPLFVYLVQKYAPLFYDELEKFVEFGIIDLQNTADKKRYNDALGRLGTAMANGDQDEIQKASDNFDDALRDVIVRGMPHG